MPYVSGELRGSFFRTGADLLHGKEQGPVVQRRPNEPEMFIEGDCSVIDGVHQQRPDTHGISDPGNTQDAILQE